MLILALLLNIVFGRSCFEQRWPLGFDSFFVSNSTYVEKDIFFLLLKDFTFSNDGQALYVAELSKFDREILIKRASQFAFSVVNNKNMEKLAFEYSYKSSMKESF